MPRCGRSKAFKFRKPLQNESSQPVLPRGKALIAPTLVFAPTTA